MSELSTNGLDKYSVGVDLPIGLIPALRTLMQQMCPENGYKPLDTEFRIKGNNGDITIHGVLQEIDVAPAMDTTRRLTTFDSRYGSPYRSEGSAEFKSYTTYAEFTPTTKENKMFGKYVITDVTIGDIHPITLEDAIKTLAKNNSKIRMVEKKDVTYLIVDSADPVELEGPVFKEMLQKALLGKTISEVESNSDLSQLIRVLNVIGSITLTKPKTSIEAMFK